MPHCYIRVRSYNKYFIKSRNLKTLTIMEVENTITPEDIKELFGLINDLEEQISILDSMRRIMAKDIMELSERVTSLEN